MCDIVRTRLAQPDLAELLLPAADAETLRVLNATIDAKVARIEQVEHDYDAGDIDGRRYRVATEKARAELAAARGQLARLTGGAGAAEEVLFGDDPAASFDAAPLMIRRSVIDLLMQVRVLSAPRGRKVFDPETVKIDGGWRDAGIVEIVCAHVDRDAAVGRRLLDIWTDDGGRWGSGARPSAVNEAEVVESRRGWDSPAGRAAGWCGCVTGASSTG